MSPVPKQSSHGVWIGAFLVAVVLHLGALLGVERIDLFAAPDDLPPPEESPTIQLVFPQEEPQTFTELPLDRADEPPEEADFLSNVDSRARDMSEGGEDRMPNQDGRVEFPQVEMVEGSVPQADGVEEPEFSDPTEDSSPDPPLEEPDPEDRGSTEPDPKEVFQPSRSSAPPGETWVPPGNSDIRQERSASPGSNAELPGDISLNTTAWDWAPWLGEFRRKLIANWSAPIGYRLGMTHGFTVMRLTIHPDGTLTQLDVLDEKGHQALKQSSLDAVGRTRPFQPLPVDFPEEHLILTLTLSYPEAPRFGR